MLASNINKVNITSAKNDFVHSKHKLCSDHCTDTESLASSAAHKGENSTVVFVESRILILCTTANREPWIHFCTSPAVRSFIIIYFHQLETSKTHLRPLIMQTREPLCHTRTMHPKISVKCIWKKQKTTETSPQKTKTKLGWWSRLKNKYIKCIGILHE